MSTGSINAVLPYRSELIWKIITDPTQHAYIGIPFYYGPILTDDIRVGSAYEAKSMIGSGTWMMYVTALTENEYIAFGQSPNRVDWSYRLQNQDNNTIVTIRREFRDHGITEKLMNFIMKRDSESQGNQKLLLRMVNDLERHCANTEAQNARAENK